MPEHSKAQEKAIEEAAESSQHPSHSQETAAREHQAQNVDRALGREAPEGPPRTISQEAAGVPSPMPSENDLIIDGLPLDPAVMRDSMRPELAQNSGELADVKDAEVTAEHARMVRSAGA